MRNRAGFTLLEVLVVIAILAIIASVAVVKYMAYLKDASVKTAEMRLREVGKTLEIYYSNNFQYPETLEELVAPQEEGKSSVLKASALVDPWKNPIEYVVREGEEPPFDLISYGPDGREGTEDDISYATIEAMEEEEALR
ncbi:MAG: type II secretion system protein GspG [Planctomycetes bacterium]|nr:type II secretion system protein GspG [Planctomycetota bacterium]